MLCEKKKTKIVALHSDIRVFFDVAECASHNWGLGVFLVVGRNWESVSDTNDTKFEFLFYF
jgi:hypothetical protein